MPCGPIENATFVLSKKEVKDDDDEDADTSTVDGVKVKISGVAMPKEIRGLRIKMGCSTYKMGIGGLHSMEKRASHYADDEVVLRDADVGAFYPALILLCGLYPEHLGPEFLDVYRSIRERRMAAKRAKDKVTDMTLKIVLNGTFGKLGSKWSFLYAPNLMIQVTITGQLALLMLIEDLEQADSVISANTDGMCRSSQGPRKIITRSSKTGHRRLQMDHDYSALHSMSVKATSRSNRW